MGRKPKNPKVLTYKGVNIYLNLDTERFYANDEITKERWEDESLWRIRKLIDEPVWEACDITAISISTGSYAKMCKLHASRRNARREGFDFVITDTTHPKKYRDQRGKKFDKSYDEGVYKITDKRLEAFDKIKLMSQDIENMEHERSVIAQEATK